VSAIFVGKKYRTPWRYRKKNAPGCREKRHLLAFCGVLFSAGDSGRIYVSATDNALFAFALSSRKPEANSAETWCSESPTGGAGGSGRLARDR